MHAAGPKSKKMNAAPVRKSHVKKGKGARCHAKTITMASACTGWGSDVLAAEMLKLPAQHAFGVEKDPVVREIALAMHEYTAFYNDVFDKHFFKEKSTDFFFLRLSLSTFLMPRNWTGNPSQRRHGDRSNHQVDHGEKTSDIPARKCPGVGG